MCNLPEKSLIMEVHDDGEATTAAPWFYAKCWDNLTLLIEIEKIVLNIAGSDWERGVIVMDNELFMVK